MKVYKSTMVLLFLLFPVSIMEYFNLGLWGQIWTYTAFIVAFMLLIKYKKFEGKIVFGIIIQIACSIWQLISTEFAGGDIGTDILYLRYQIIRFLIILIAFGMYKRQVLIILNRLLIVSGCINFISVIMNVIYMHSVSLNAEVFYFLGYRYVFCTFAVLALPLGYICKDYSALDKWIYKIQFFLLWMTVLIAGPSTLLGGLLTYTVLLYGTEWQVNNQRIDIRLSYLGMAILAIVLNIGIVFFNIQERFAFIIKTVLNRDLTFTGRSIIWATCIEEFTKGNPWLGLGNSLAFGYNGWGNLGWPDAKYAAHNQLLTWLTNTGIVGTVLQLLFFIWCIMMILKLSNGPVKKVLGISFSAMIIMSISTQYVPYRFIELYGLIIAFIYANFRNNKSLFELEKDRS